MKNEKNLMFREILLYVVLLDIVLNLSVYALDLMGINICEMILRIVLDYLLIFYMWYPVRYVEYKEGNPDLHILDWTGCLVVESVVCMVFSDKLDKVSILFSIVCLIYTFLIFRYLVFYRRGYLFEKSEFIGQMKKDISVILPLVGCLPVSTLGYVFKQDRNGLIFLFILYLWIMIIGIVLYGVHSIRYVICQEITSNKIVKAVIHSMILFFVIILGIILCQNRSGISGIGIKIYFATLELLLIMLFINRVDKITGVERNR